MSEGWYSWWPEGVKPILPPWRDAHRTHDGLLRCAQQSRSFLSASEFDQWMWQRGAQLALQRYRPLFMDMLTDVYGDKCLHCGAVAPLALDHIHPITLGGETGLFNLQLLCVSCNSSKAQRCIDYRPFELTKEVAAKLIKHYVFAQTWEEHLRGIGEYW